MTPYTPHFGDWQELLGPMEVAGINGVKGGVAGINGGEWGLSDIGYWVGLAELVDINGGSRNE